MTQSAAHVVNTKENPPYMFIAFGKALGADRAKRKENDYKTIFVSN